MARATQASSPREEFGVVIPCIRAHLHWARGACASVRTFMEGTPICLLFDGERGDVPPDMTAADDIQVICRDDVANRELRDAAFRSLRAKSAAPWVSPFSTYLLLDADAIVWGDVRPLADFERFDFVLDTPIGDRAEVRKSVFDADAVTAAFPEFDAHSHVDDYVNAGAYFGRRDALDLDRYLAFLRFARSRPGCAYADQGPFNFLVFEAADQGRLRLQQRPLQVLTGRSTRAALERRFAFADGRPVVHGEPVVLHWVSSPKPRVRGGRNDYFAPMTHFRLLYRAQAHGGPSRVDRLRLRLEDAACTDFRGTNLLGRWAGWRRRLGRRYRHAKHAVRQRVPDGVVRALRR